MDVYDFDFDEYLRVQRAKVLAANAMTAFLELGQNRTLFDAAADGLDRALHRLDRVPRSDPFWRNQNHHPTAYKLQNLQRQRFSELKDDLDFAWSCVALAAATGNDHLPRCRLWHLLPRAELPAEWLLEASWLELVMWGPEMPMMDVARALGRDAELAALLSARGGSPNLEVRIWVDFELGR
jgi:hypothetical protein